MRKPNPELDASDFVLLADYVPSVIQEIRYHSTYNFIGERIDGYEDPVALCTRECARALKTVAGELFVQGYRLKVFDAYRPTSAVKHFVLWGIEDADQRMKPYFYPDIDKTDTFKLGYIASRSSHSRGSTVDLTLFDMAARLTWARRLTTLARNPTPPIAASPTSSTPCACCCRRR